MTDRTPSAIDKVLGLHFAVPTVVTFHPHSERGKRCAQGCAWPCPTRELLAPQAAHDPKHDDWDAGGYCNAVVLGEHGDGEVCGYHKPAPARIEYGVIRHPIAPRMDNPHGYELVVGSTFPHEETARKARDILTPRHTDTKIGRRVAPSKWEVVDD